MLDVEVSWSFVPEFRNVVLVKGIVSASSQRSPWATGATCPSRGLLRACGLIWWVFAAWVKREPNEKTRCLVMSKLGTGCRRWSLGLLFRQGHIGLDAKILENRKEVYEAAMKRNPNRWTRNVRAWNRVDAVGLNPRPDVA